MPHLAKLPRRLACLLAAMAFAVAPMSLARAHPHVFVEAKTELVFNAKGETIAVRQIWRFDGAFSAFATQGLDENKDGKLSDDELKPLADVNIESLKEFEYFTFMTVGKTDADFVKPTEYWLDYSGGLLTLFFTLPLKTPLSAKGVSTELQVFDPVYFVAFKMVKEQPFALIDAPAGCTLKTERAAGPDAQAATALAAIPNTQREIPKELKTVTETLSNTAEVTCR